MTSKIVHVLIAMALASGCTSGDQAAPNAVESRPAPGLPEAEQETSNDWFVDRAVESGLLFQYFNGMSGQFYFPEMLPGGVALFDYDNDGDLDVYLAQGQMLGDGKTPSQAQFPPSGSGRLIGRLFR